MMDSESDEGEIEEVDDVPEEVEVPEVEKPEFEITEPGEAESDEQEAPRGEKPEGEEKEERESKEKEKEKVKVIEKNKAKEVEKEKANLRKLFDRMGRAEGSKMRLMDDLRSMLREKYQEIHRRLEDEKEIAKQSIKDAIPEV